MTDRSRACYTVRSRNEKHVGQPQLLNSNIQNVYAQEET